MINGTVPYPQKRWKPSQSWSADMDRRSHPDRAKEQDVTALNLAKQKYVRDAKMLEEERFELQMEIHSTILDFIRKPYFPAANNQLDGQADQNDGSKILGKVAARKKYLVVHFSYYFAIRGFHYPAEFALAEFSVFNGLGAGVSGLIDIGEVPLGYSGSVRDRAKETCNPHPPFDKEFNAYNDALGLIENFVRRHFPGDEQVILFAPKEFVPIVMNGFEWLFGQSGHFFNVRILPLSVLVQLLVNESQGVEYQGVGVKPEHQVLHESHLDAPLHDTYYAYSPELACEFHSLPENERGVQHCSENNVKRLIFNACKVLTPFFKIKSQKNVHYPCQRAPDPKPKMHNGLKVYEVPNIRRMAEIQRFVSSERMYDLLRSASHSGLSSGAGSSRNSPAPSDNNSSSNESSGQSSGETSLNSEESFESVDTVELDPPDDSEGLLSYFRLDPDFHYPYSPNDFLPLRPLPAEYSQDRPTYEQALANFVGSQDSSGSSDKTSETSKKSWFRDRMSAKVGHSKPNSGIKLEIARESSTADAIGKPCGRGRGRGRMLSSLSTNTSATREPSPILPVGILKETVKSGQFDNAKEDLVRVLQKRPKKVSRCFDAMSKSSSTKTTLSGSSKGSDKSLQKIDEKSDDGISLTARSSNSSAGTPKSVMLAPWESVDTASVIGSAITSQAFDSVSTCGGYQVDELATSDEENSEGDFNESASLAAMKQLAL